MAQLRSQRGAVDWMTAAPGIASVTAPAAATMALVALFVDAWGIQGGKGPDDMCPFKGCGSKQCGGPTTVHAMTCMKQALRGYHSTHTMQKRCLQRLLRQQHVPWVTNEDASVFSVADRRADTAIGPGALSLAKDTTLQYEGVVVDSTVRAPVADYMLPPTAGARANAATKDGFAAAAGEKQKRKHHENCLLPQWRFVPFVQETFGRLGPAARAFLRQVASHSAAAQGGHTKVIERRAGIVYRHMLVALGASLARELAERVFAYVRGARLAGWTAHPVLAILTGSVTSSLPPLV